MADNPMERGQQENMALILQAVMKKLEDQSKLIQNLQGQRLQEAAAGPSNSSRPESGDGRVPRGTKRRRRTASKVPHKCRDDVRKMYRVLVDGQNDFDGFDLTESVSSPTNDSVITALRAEVVKDYGGAEKCPFSPKEMRDAAVRYFRSQRDDKVRREKGKMTAHRASIRKRQRLVQKVERRSRALEKAQDWTEKSKKRVEEFLHEDFMSSESSGEEDQEGYTVRRLAWESKSLRKLKDSLDEVCPQRGVVRVESTVLSNRDKPEGTPAWAITRRRQADRGPNLDDSLTE
ncbi:uncharacterized protein LOC118418659 [Branchiostoma floridae]|uniref:Uncharacterized protein LOC118418659 n=1 Tax=Branchiostoma floridae TaxID=7739 RepID=C3ZUP4_BRAFL|nr:uncharacterized protein LOC118418659 [Branchiostoma floridae]|eukprot:XP_002587745.1 hypothetical protein BRAFLDRAFT_127393 [Branchiostoma floridae]